MKKILYLLIFIAIGCKTAQKEASKDKETIMEFVTVAKGALYGAGEEGVTQGNFVVNNEKEWNALVEKMDATNKISSNFKELPIDFSKHMLICVFDKVRSTGGIDVTITSIGMDKKEVSVIYSIKKASSNGMSTTVMTQPFHIVKTGKRSEKIIFTNSEEN